jgi:glutamate/tyrosine decarboxylase-like PLP-dependent enzyme
MDAKLSNETSDLQDRKAPLAIGAEEFRKLGHELVDKIAEFLDGLPHRPVTTGESPQAIRKLLGSDDLPEQGSPARELFARSADLLFDHSLFNGHPRFWGYITSSAAPIGILAEMLAATVNPNVGAAILAPMASEIEAQTIRWIADLVGYPRTCGGLLVSGGNMANFVGFLAACKAKANWDLKTDGMAAGDKQLIAYVSKETHTWIDKAAELFGLGAKNVRWIETDVDQRISVEALEKQIVADLDDDLLPFLVVGAAGTVSTGAVDPLSDIASICTKYDLWFHVDGAYGAPAAILQDAPADLLALREADSIALDPHKWLYSPLEAGCTLVRDPRNLAETFGHKVAYYNFEGSHDDPPVNYHNLGPQNSRGFRALKVWLGLQHVGREGYVQMIGDDIRLSKALYEIVKRTPELEPITQGLSITTFRYVPERVSDEAYLNNLNEEILNRLQKGGEVFVSNAIVDSKYVLRACIVNFRTTLFDVEALADIVVRLGKEVHSEMHQ